MTIPSTNSKLLVTEDWTKIYQSLKNADFQSYDFETIRRVLVSYVQENFPEDFNDYIDSKYPDGSAYNTVHHYEKIISQYDSSSQQTTVRTIQIDEDTYNTFENTTTSYSFPSGTTTVTTNTTRY